MAPPAWSGTDAGDLWSTWKTEAGPGVCLKPNWTHAKPSHTRRLWLPLTGQWEDWWGGRQGPHNPSPASSPLWPPLPLTALQTPCSQSRTKLPPKQKMRPLNKTLPPSFPSPPRSLQPTPWILTREHFIYTKWIRKKIFTYEIKTILISITNGRRQSPLCSRLLFATVGLVFYLKGVR